MCSRTESSRTAPLLSGLLCLTLPAFKAEQGIQMSGKRQDDAAQEEEAHHGKLLMHLLYLGQVIDNMKGLVEIMARSDEIAEKAQQMVARVLEVPEPGRVYR